MKSKRMNYQERLYKTQMNEFKLNRRKINFSVALNEPFRVGQQTIRAGV